MIGRFTPLYILANLGAHLGFLPLLVLLLPRRVEAIADGEPLVLLSQLLLLGGVTASLAHIASGAFSDRWIARHGNRRGPIAIGLALLVVSYVLFSQAFTVPSLALSMVCFQVSLNVMFAPLGALLTDHVPHERKGWIAGWLNMALPLAGLAIGLLGFISTQDARWPFLLLAGAIALAVLPLVSLWPRALPLVEAKAERAQLAASLLPRDFAFAWIARLAIQTGAAMILSYLYLYVDLVAGRSAVFPSQGASEGVATLSVIATIVSLAAGIIAGRLSDRSGRRKLPLIATSLAAGGALLLLAWAPDWRVILAGYAIFTAALTAFLSVDSALVAQLLAGHHRRGAMLGVMNLTNTLPAIIAPSVALLLAAVSFEAATLRMMLGAAAAGATIAAIAIAGIRSVR
ncbi:MFS transporter [Sphingomicrobium clamense]|uniref:MFS transporter n=1 Tax=Sphingomicrobium clamense TaxID=2851013 RepID=A0ABS6V2T1_9SPHN|nr:MFS transporter [Sphingomicrobium sp. B8]MBW0143826.1 MFS transporter [Sphingomicrobium sp. B8]